MCRSRPLHGFTLIELLVAVSLIGLLIALLLPALGRSRDAARGVVCLSHLHQSGVASHAYLLDSRQRFWRYYVDDAGGRRWWFGYESGGPGVGTHRPLDKSRSMLSLYLSTDSDAFNCPAFPYGHAAYFPKFARRGASLGYNLHLGPANTANPTARADRLAQPSQVFVLADGIHFDANPGFNEGHYILHTANIALRSGYGHFRHLGQAQLLMADGHAKAIPLRGSVHANVAGKAANLIADDGSTRHYGF